MRYVLLAALIWGSSFPVITYGLESISPFLFVHLRFLLAFLLILPLVIHRGSLRALFEPGLVGIGLLNALAYLLQFKGQELTTAAKSALLINTNPLFVIMLSPLLLKKNPTGRQVGALLVAFVGVLIVTTHFISTSC